MLDMHGYDDTNSAMWCGDPVSGACTAEDEASLFGAWSTVADRYCGSPNVIAADLFNEPYGATWGTGNVSTDWDLAAERLGAHVHAQCPRWLVVVQGIANRGGWCRDHSGYGCWWGEMVIAHRYHPVSLPDPKKLVLSPHAYGANSTWHPYLSASDFPNNMPAIWDAHWGSLPSLTQTAILLGEWGGRMSETGEWQRAMAAYLVQRGIGHFYWSLNDNSYGTGGLFDPSNEDKLVLLSMTPSTSIREFQITVSSIPPSTPPPLTPPPLPPPASPPLAPPPQLPPSPDQPCKEKDFRDGRTRLGGYFTQQWCYDRIPYNSPGAIASHREICESFYVDPVAEPSEGGSYLYDCSAGCVACHYTLVRSLYRCVSLDPIFFGCGSTASLPAWPPTTPPYSPTLPPPLPITPPYRPIPDVAPPSVPHPPPVLEVHKPHPPPHPPSSSLPASPSTSPPRSPALPPPLPINPPYRPAPNVAPPLVPHQPPAFEVPKPNPPPRLPSPPLPASPRTSPPRSPAVPPPLPISLPYSPAPNVAPPLVPHPPPAFEVPKPDRPPQPPSSPLPASPPASPPRSPTLPPSLPISLPYSPAPNVAPPLVPRPPASFEVPEPHPPPRLSSSPLPASPPIWASCSDTELLGDLNGRNGFTLGDAVYVAQQWAGSAPTTPCMNGGDYSQSNGLTIGDAVFVATVWAGKRSWPWEVIDEKKQ